MCTTEIYTDDIGMQVHTFRMEIVVRMPLNKQTICTQREK